MFNCLYDSRLADNVNLKATRTGYVYYKHINTGFNVYNNGPTEDVSVKEVVLEVCQNSRNETVNVLLSVVIS